MRHKLRVFADKRKWLQPMGEYRESPRKKNLTSAHKFVILPMHTRYKNRTMKTKTLLLAGLVCAASAATSMAQVYSLNAVGFVNVTCPPGFCLIANPLNFDGTNSLNAIIPSVPRFCQLFKFNVTSGQYDIASMGTSGWGGAPLTASPGEGFFFKNPYTTNIVITYTGSVQQGTLNTPLVAGFQIASSQVPQTGLLSTDLLFPPARFDQVFTFNTTTMQYDIFSVTAVSSGSATWGLAGEPTIAVGQSFFVKKAAATTWTRTFSTSQ
jgi:hypothetical protein